MITITRKTKEAKRQVPHRLAIYGMLGVILGGLVSQVLICSRVNAIANAENTVGETNFSGFGRYGITTIGNNNAYRGESFDTMNATGHLITPEQNSNLPSNWESIKHQIETNGEWGNPTVTNLSGSKLELNGGKVQYARYAGYSCDNGGKGVILINPKGTLKIIDKAPEYFKDVTEFVNEGGEGWYYAFYPEITVESCAQAAWSITTIYEKPSLPLSFVELKSEWKWIDGDEATVAGREEYIMFDRPISSNSEFQLIGVYIGAGGRGWEIDNETTSTKDETYAVFRDNTEQQLGASSYKGKTVFEGRPSTNFANGTFHTIRSHNYKGGELDIFDETLDSGYFAEHELAGYHFIKTGNNYYNPALFGYRQIISNPVISVTPVIPDSDPTHPTVILENTSKQVACATKMVIPLADLGNPTSITLDPSTGATSSVSGDDLVVEISNLAPTEKIVLSLTIPESKTGSIVLHPKATYYPSIDGICLEGINNNRSFMLIAEGKDVFPHSNETPTDKSGDIAVPDTGSFTNNQNYLLPISVSFVGLIGGGLVVWLTRRKITSKHVGFAKK